MDRQAVMSDLLAELSSHTPAAAMRYMRHWPGGRLSLVHVNVMSLLELDGSLPMRGLAEALDVSQASATGIVDRMEQRGLVERQRDDEDRRIVRVALTEEGRRLLAGIAKERRDHLGQVLEEMTDEELASFLLGARAMRRARERLHAARDAADPAAPQAARNAAWPAAGPAESPGAGPATGPTANPAVSPVPTKEASR